MTKKVPESVVDFLYEVRSTGKYNMFTEFGKFMYDYTEADKAPPEAYQFLIDNVDGGYIELDGDNCMLALEALRERVKSVRENK